MPKLIEAINERTAEGDLFFSLEFFPPRTREGAVNLVSRFDSMAKGDPLFIDITWGAGGGVPDDDTLHTSSMNIASTALNYCGLPTMLHLTCTGLTKKTVIEVLDRAKKLGIRNIMALRGDAPPGTDWTLKDTGLNYGVDLVKLIRAEFGDYFGICVAGYPNGHPECDDYNKDILYLKDKVDAGADFIITQLFFEVDTFVKFVSDCRAVGITCPIIPGILPIQGYASLRHLTKLSKLTPPDSIVQKIEQLKDDDAAIRTYGIQLATQMCRDLMAAGIAPGFHFYTLNREVAVKQILKNLNLWKTTCTKNLPWQTSANDRRCNEHVRPIFWSTRPKSYLMRTRDWDDFPNGRWGDSSSPAYGDLSGYYLFTPAAVGSDELRRFWGEPMSFEDVYKVFVSFIKGDGRVKKLPWAEGELEAETISESALHQTLVRLNENGILTINSQPATNGVPSTDPVHGWGGPNGYIYKKAYMEFFCCPQVFQLLLEILQDYPMMTYHALNASGSENHSNSCSLSPNAVTWGVFPAKEIIQPTVVDPVSFPIWKDEAFELWHSQWAKIYDEGSVSRQVIETIHDTFFLVNIVDNDYINCKMIEMFDRLLERLNAPAR